MVVSFIAEDGLAARALINSLLNGAYDPQVPFDAYSTLGTWAEDVRMLIEVYSDLYTTQGREMAAITMKSAVAAIRRTNPSVAQLMSFEEDTSPPIVSPSVKKKVLSLINAPHKPNMTIQAILDHEEEYADARRWLDTYCAFSSKWANRTHPSFHELIGLWMLSAISMRRIQVRLGAKLFYTPIYAALGAKSSAYTKTTACNIALDVLEQAGLDWIAQDSKATPEVFYKIRAGTAIPENFDVLEPEEKALEETIIAHAAQRALFFPEFGVRLQRMLATNGNDQKMLDLLLDWFDCPKKDSNTTISRGADRVRMPFLALLANLPPESVSTLPKNSRDPWLSGLFARFCIVSPPRTATSNEFFLLERYPGIPEEVWQPLQRFHEMLTPAQAKVQIRGNEGDGKKQGKEEPKYTVDRKPYPVNECTLSDEAYYIMKEYHVCMQEMLSDEDHAVPSALEAWYNRAPSTALSIAALLSAMENGFSIEALHMNAAICIVERFRYGINEFYQQVREETDGNNRSKEDKVLQQLARWPSVKGTPLVKAHEVAQYCNIGTQEATMILESLATDGVVYTIERAPKRGKKAMKFFYLPEYAYSVLEADKAATG